MASQYINLPVESSGGVAGVTTLNGLDGNLALVAGTNITITPAGSFITIDASDADMAIGATVDGSTPFANLYVDVDGNLANSFSLLDSTGKDSIDFDARALKAASGISDIPIIVWDFNSVSVRSGRTFSMLAADDTTETVSIDGGSGAMSLASTLTVSDIIAPGEPGPSIAVSGKILYSLFEGVTLLSSVDWQNRTLNDGGDIAVGWGSDKKLYTGGLTSLDWNERQAFDSSSAESMDWEGRFLFDTSGNVSIAYGARISYGTSFIKSQDWNQRILYSYIENPIFDYSASTDEAPGGAAYWFDTSGNLHGNGGALENIKPSLLYGFNHEATLVSVDGDNKQLLDNTALTPILSIDWDFRLINNSAGATLINYRATTDEDPGGTAYWFNTSNILQGDGSGLTNITGASVSKVYQNDLTTIVVDGENRLLIGEDTNTRMDWENRFLYYGNEIFAIPSIDFGFAILNDTSGNTSLNWASRQAINGNGILVIDYDVGTLYADIGDAPVISVDYQNQMLKNGDAVIMSWGLFETNPGLSFFGGTLVNRQFASGTDGTAGASYTSNEQAMLQSVFNALVNYNLLSPEV